MWEHSVEGEGSIEIHRSRLDDLADRYTAHGFRFAPLIGPHYGLACSLDILFLRRGAPGGTIQGTDIDNRLKTLLDALKVPKYPEELGDATPQREEDPFFCLLSDDSVITQISITTDRLLLSTVADESDELVQTEAEDDGATKREAKVYMVIHVKTVTSNPHQAYVEMSM